MQGLLQDLRYAARMLLANRVFAAAAVLPLALGMRSAAASTRATASA